MKTNLLPLFVLLILEAIALTACNIKSVPVIQPKTVTGETALKRYEDKEVVCYRVTGYEGIWCYRKEQNPSCPAPQEDPDIPFIIEKHHGKESN